jgi:hypothetical protein
MRDVINFMAGWDCVILAALLFMIRPLLRYRLWRSWVVFGVVGAGLLVTV